MANIAKRINALHIKALASAEEAIDNARAAGALCIPDDKHHKLPSLPGDERSTAGYMREHHAYVSEGVAEILKAACDAFPSEPDDETPKEPEVPESAGTWLRDQMEPIICECKRKFPDVPAFLAAGVVETLTAEWRK